MSCFESSSPSQHTCTERDAPEHVDAGAQVCRGVQRYSTHQRPAEAAQHLVSLMHASLLLGCLDGEPPGLQVCLMGCSSGTLQAALLPSSLCCRNQEEGLSVY